MKKVTPDHLYMATTIQRFMRRCTERALRWAIFSDYYGIWFADELHEWYGDDVGDPSRVKEPKFRELLKNFDERLQGFDEIYFYYPGRVHPLHKRLLQESGIKDRVVEISHLADIV